MSGHSKWSQIKHKKGAADERKGQLFSKFSKVISLAAKGGTDPTSNFELKNAIQQAREANMPNDSIERAITRGGDSNSAQLESIQIEAIGPSGSAFIVEAITDNRNRTLTELKMIFKKHNIKMVPPHSVIWMFEQHGSKLIPKNMTTVSQEESSAIGYFLDELGNHEDVKEIVSNLLSG